MTLLRGSKAIGTFASTARHFRQLSSETASCGRPTINDVLQAYPLFNLNAEERDLRGRLLGPRRGDEAVLTLSGGVDSSVAAYMALTAGGLQPSRTIFMRNWNSLEEKESFEPGAGGSSGCQWMQDWDCVQRTARWLGVGDQVELVDLSTTYWNAVFSPSLDEWSQGRTPNPDILCNREVKFGELLRKLDTEQKTASSAFGNRRARQWLVTGHYAGIRYFYPSEEADVQHGRLLRAFDLNKDQAFFLSGVSSSNLGRSHFPLAGVRKTDVRSLARRLDMPTAESQESMGICFVGKRNKQPVVSDIDRRRESTLHGFAAFLSGYIEQKPGKIVSLNGAVLGHHSGLHTMTVGQRARIGGTSQRLFVAAKRADTNEIVVVPSLQHPMLRCVSLDVAVFHAICSPAQDDLFFRLLDKQTHFQAQVRHRQEPVSCRAELLKRNPDGSTLHLRLHFDSDRTMDSVAEGQVCALYLERECFGSGVISSVTTLAASTAK
jgi:tRNA-specific 2-thiouridylase